MLVRRSQLGLFGVLAALLALGSPARGGGTLLKNGTATFSEVITDGPYTPAHAIDGDFGDRNGWGIARVDASGGTNREVAVWETTADLAAGNLTFALHFAHFNPGHLLGRFRFSVTTDDRSTFADGLPSGGDVDADWIVLTDPVVTGPDGMSFTTLADQSILVGGKTADRGAYTVTYRTTVRAITGVRLEVLEHPTLPGGDGPGLFPRNGDFLLTELTLDAPVATEAGPTGPRRDRPNP